MDINNKKEAAGKISLFLETLFATIEALEVSFCITKDNQIIILDNMTGLSSTFTPEKFQETYKKWAKKEPIGRGTYERHI